MVYILNAGHEVLLFAVTGFVIIFGAFFLVLICRCCKRCKSKRSAQQPTPDFIYDSPGAPLIPAGSQGQRLYPGGTFYGTEGIRGGGEYQQHFIYAPGTEYYSRGPNGEFYPVAPPPPGQNHPIITGYEEQGQGMMIPNPPPYGGEPPPPYESFREFQQHRMYSGQLPGQTDQSQQQQGNHESKDQI